MEEIRNEAQVVFRDKVAPGSSTDYWPDKPLIRALFNTISDAVDALFLSQGSGDGGVVYNTRAELYANLAPAANTAGTVYNDPNPAYNGVYKKNGASGTGSWTKISDLVYQVLAARLDVVEDVTVPLTGIDGLTVGDNGEITFDLDGIVLCSISSKGVRVAGATFQWTSDALFEICTSDGLVLAEMGWTESKGFGGDDDGGGGGAAPAMVRRLWTGAPEPTTIKFAFDVEGDAVGTSVVEISQDSFFTVLAYRSPPFVPMVTDRAIGTYWRSVVGKAAGLQPGTAYKLRVVVDGRVSDQVVSFETLPAAGTSVGFSFVAGSCSDLVSGTVAKALQAAAVVTPRPKFMLHMGDLIYSNIDENDVRLQRSSNTRAYRNNASAAALCAVMPHIYIFDDHDFSVNDCDWDTVYPDGATFEQIGRNTRRAIRETTPIYDPVQTPKGPPLSAVPADAYVMRAGNRVDGLINLTRTAGGAPVISVVGPIVVGDTPTVILDGVNYNYTLSGGSSTAVATIADNLKNRIDTSARYIAKRSLGVLTVALRNEEFDPDRTILAQQFDCGLVRFIVPDTRSQRRWQSGTPTCLGEARGHEYWNQTAWLRTALVQAGTDGMRRVFLVTATGWIGAVYDSWGDRFPADQAALCDYMRDTPGIPPVSILTGDFHHSAMDDGTNADKSTGGGLSLAHIMSSPLFRTPLTGGGPFSWNGVNGDMPGYSETFVEITVDDDEEFVCDFWDASTYDAVAGTPATLIRTFSTKTVMPAVQFAAASSTGAASAPKVVNLVSSWFARAGKDSRRVTFTRSDGGAGGFVSFNSNSRKATLTTNAPASGSVIITISAPVDCALGLQTTHTLTAV